MGHPVARLERLQGSMREGQSDPSSAGLCCSHRPAAPGVGWLCIPLPGPVAGGAGARRQGAGVQQPRVSRETGKPRVSLAESWEVRKWCLLLVRIPGQWHISKPVPSCGDGLFLPAEGKLLSQWWWGQTKPKVTVQCGAK